MPKKHTFITTNNREYNSYIFFGFLLLSYLLVFRNLYYTQWKQTQFLFSFQQGFFSRALAGTIIQTIAPKYSGSTLAIQTISALITFALSTILAILGYWYWKIDRNRKKLMIAGIFISSPGTIQFFAHDSGRFDQIGYILVITALLLFPVIPRKIHWLLIALLSIVLVLLNEALLFIAAPLLVVIALSTRIDTGRTPKEAVKLIFYSFLSLLPAILLALIFVTITRFEYSQQLFQETMSRLNNLADFEISACSLMVHFRSIEDNLVVTRERVLSIFSIFDILRALIMLIPSGIIAFFVFANSLKVKNKTTNKLFVKIIKVTVIICCFAPLLLVLVGYDYPRWMAMAITNLFIAGIITQLQRTRVETKNNRETLAEIPNIVLGIIIVFSLAFGPVTATGKLRRDSFSDCRAVPSIAPARCDWG